MSLIEFIAALNSESLPFRKSNGLSASFFLIINNELQNNILTMLFIIHFMEKQEVKLVKSENGGEEYHILINKVVGRGGFGIVNQARAVDNPKQRLVVKTIKIESEQKRKVIQNELKIMSQLPYQQNLVKVIPVKMYSSKNYYIFMQYCQGGTLYQQYLAKKNHHFQEQNLYQIFYQCMNGYKALYDKKILHQDIKLENILIRKGVYKLADFGLSLFYQGHDFGDSREGTISYIAPEKLTIRDYVGNPKSDIYSFGIMFFEMITGYHPYVVSGGRRVNHREFIKELINSKLRMPNNLNNRYSLKFQIFFDLILKMIKRHQSDRIDFDHIWNYIRASDLFEKIREKQKQISKKYLIEQYDFVITEITDVLTLPVFTSKEEEDQLRKRFEDKLKEQNPRTIELGNEVATYFIKRRLIVFYLDRLARKLIVQQLKQQTKCQVSERTIFYLMIFVKSLLNDLVMELRSPKQIDSESFSAFKRTNSMALDITNLLRKDHEYVEDSICQLLHSTKTISKQQLKIIFLLLKANQRQTLVNDLKRSLEQLLKIKTGIIEVNNKSQLLTLISLLTINDVLQDLPQAVVDAEELEVIDKNALTSNIPHLISCVQTRCSQKGLICSFDFTGLYEQEDEQQMIAEPFEPIG